MGTWRFTFVVLVVFPVDKGFSSKDLAVTQKLTNQFLKIRGSGLESDEFSLVRTEAIHEEEVVQGRPSDAQKFRERVVEFKTALASTPCKVGWFLHRPKKRCLLDGTNCGHESINLPRIL